MPVGILVDRASRGEADMRQGFQARNQPRDAPICSELPPTVNVSALHNQPDCWRCCCNATAAPVPSTPFDAAPRVLLTPDFHVGIAAQSDLGRSTVRFEIEISCTYYPEPVCGVARVTRDLVFFYV
jgi:hypothetical protein